MSKLVNVVQAASSQVVEIDGVKWQIKPLTSADMVRNGHAFLAMFSGAPEEQTAEERAAELAANEEVGLRAVTLRDAIVCAGVVAGDAGDGLEPIRFVVHEDDADPAAEVPRLWVGSLPGSTLVALQNAIVALCSDNGRLARALESFRG
jgi:hypothetical protein